jgi:hypothetical protein
MGPALGVNLAEFEFPAYFNFFVYKKQCTLVVDSQDAEDNICRVFEETLLGPKQFRREVDPITYEEEDFAPDFPREAIPNFEKELGFFRILGDGSELTLDKLLTFCHFKQPRDGYSHNNLGVPPNWGARNGLEVDELVQQDFEEADEELQVPEEDIEEADVPKSEKELDARESANSKWSYGRARWVGKPLFPVCTFLLTCSKDVVADYLFLLSRFRPQGKLLLFGRQRQLKNKNKIGLFREWKFSRCLVEPST